MATDCIGSEVAALVNGLKDGEVGGWVGERERDRERMYVYVYVWVGGCVCVRAWLHWQLGMISRLLQNIGLFCRI